MVSDQIVVAASIITMDPSVPRAKAVAISGDTGKITCVGTLAECQQVSPQAEVVDLGESVLLPGFLDAHNHPFASGVMTMDPVHWIAPYVSCPTWQDVRDYFTKAEKETSGDDPAVFTGLDRMLQGAPELTNIILDKYFPSRPVAVMDNSGHEVYFNSATISLLGWDKNPPADPVGARYGRNDDGSLNGRAYETAAVFAVLTPLLKLAVKHPLASAAKWYRLMAQHGITGTSDHSFSTEVQKAYEALASSAELPLRISLYHMSTEPDCGDELQSPIPKDRLQKAGIKLWGDGSPWVGSVADSFPYENSEVVKDAGIPIGPAGESAMNYSRLELDAILDKHAPQGWQMAFHVNGDIAIDVVLDAYERALHKHGLAGTDHRWRLEHCGAGREDQFQRAAAQGLKVSLGPFQFIYWGDLLDGQIFDSSIGSQWMQFRSAVVAGCEPSFHNDGMVSPPIPLLNIQAAITRETPSGHVHGIEQIISLDEAIAAHTTHAAKQLRRDNQVGSISVGKFADFVELSKDPFLADPTQLAQEVKVLGTWLAGKPLDLDKFHDEILAMDPTEHQHLAKYHPQCSHHQNPAHAEVAK